MRCADEFVRLRPGSPADTICSGPAGGRAACRRGREVQVAEDGERERPRDRRRRHHQHVRVAPFLAQLRALEHAELVLFVHDDERRVLELHVPLDERVRADDEVRLARRDALEVLPSLARAAAADEQRGPHAAAGEETLDRLGNAGRRGFPSAP